VGLHFVFLVKYQSIRAPLLRLDGCSLAPLNLMSLPGPTEVDGRSAYFLEAFARIGLVPDGGAAWLLTRSVGRVRAMELMGDDLRIEGLALLAGAFDPRRDLSPAAAHVAGRDDALVQVAPMLEMVADRMADLPGRQAGWKAYLALETPPETVARLRLHEGTGRPLGDGDFVHRMEKLLGRQLTPNKPGPKPKKPKRKRKREPLN
ncbi:hypothetical protein LCGC14_2234130, partial [marine sediment metagenome]